MRKDEAIYEFFSGFEWPAYAASSVPEDAIFPYISYELVMDSFDEPVSMAVNLYDYTESEAKMNIKADEVSAAIGYGGKIISCDEGKIWIQRGSPWCNSLYDVNLPGLKRRQLNVVVEYLTRD